MGKLKTIARRTFIVGSVAIAGGVLFGYWKFKQPFGNPLLDDLPDGAAALTPYVRIDANGVAIITPRAEMGQGVHTTLAALVAEELDVALDDVGIEHGPASSAYYNAVLLEEGVPYTQTDRSRMAENMREFTHVPAKFLGMQVTGGSTSVADGFTKMRTAGAAARAVLIQAAAAELGLAADSLKTERGAVVAPDGTRIAYTELAAAAAAIEPPSDPPLKAPAEWQLLGKSLPRVDMVAKSTGTAEFGIDVTLPGMRFATVRRNPRLGGSMESFDASKAESMPGVSKIVALDDGVVVVADNTWRAFQAARAIDFNWGPAPYPESSDEMLALTAAAIDNGDEDSQLRDDGDVDAALLEADLIQAEYRAPLLAHATMEPMNATALFTDGRLEVWAGNQVPTQALKIGAQITGLDEENIRIHTPYMGGGFGRRSELDFVEIAVRVAVEMKGTPVKVTWTREEDMTHDQYRPAAVARFKGAVRDGELSALDLRVSAGSVLESQMGRLGIPVIGHDVTIVQAAWDQPYAIPNYRVTGYRPPMMIPVSSWRSVGASQNGFFHESVIDEMAHAANRDPLEFRLDMVSHEPSREVLNTVRALSDWDTPLPPGQARGVAFVLSFGVPVAEVVEIQQTDRGIEIIRVSAVADVGTALDPRNIEAQLQSGINFGLSAAMMGEVTVADGAVQQDNFHTYNGIRMQQAPRIDIAFLQNGDKVRGIGEPGLPPVAPALGNAIFALTGERLRQLPFNKHVQFA